MINEVLNYYHCYYCFQRNLPPTNACNNIKRALQRKTLFLYLGFMWQFFTCLGNIYVGLTAVNERHERGQTNLARFVALQRNHARFVPRSRYPSQRLWKGS